MLRSLRERFRRSTDASAPSIEEGKRIYAIGDIHGRFDLLEALLGTIKEDIDREPLSGQVHLVFVGDLIDRGPDSKAVVSKVRELCQTTPCTALMGNHEEILVSILEGNIDALGFFLRLGGYETLLSYGVDRSLLDNGSDNEILAAMRERIPDDHQAFLRGMPSAYGSGDYLFVHAGIRPGVPLDAQSENDLHWIRQDFLKSKANHGKIIIHGHTISPEIDERANRIGIDTGAYSTGHLSAIALEGIARWYLTTC